MPDIPFYWQMVKNEIARLAKTREKEMVMKENSRKIYLEGMYSFLLGSKDMVEDIEQVKAELNQIYDAKARRILQ